MSDDGDNGRFVLELPDPDAALALAGEAESTLHRLSALTGASLVLRGLQLVITGRSSQIERAAAVVEQVERSIFVPHVILAFIGKSEHSMELIVSSSNYELDFLLAAVVDLLATDTYLYSFEVGTSHHIHHASYRVGAI